MTVIITNYHEYHHHGRTTFTVTSITTIITPNNNGQQRSPLSSPGINEAEQMSIFRVLASILHLGNIEIGGSDHAEVYSDDPALQTFCELMGVEMQTMSIWLINRKITTVNETMVKALNKEEVSRLSL